MKNALVTGASSGIGYSYSLELAKRGYNLTVVARSKDKLEALKNKIIDIYPERKVKIILSDLSKSNNVKKLINSEKNIHYDLLINNAGFGITGVFSDEEISRQINMINLNIQAVVNMTHAFIQKMKSKGGTIINISSIATIPGYFPKMAVYSSTKKFVDSFSRSVNFELKKTGLRKIRVVSVRPGIIATSFFDEMKLENNVEKLATNPDKFAKISLSKILDKKNDRVTYGACKTTFKFAKKILPNKIFASILFKVNH